jgi:hypothetical protein
MFINPFDKLAAFSAMMALFITSTALIAIGAQAAEPIAAKSAIQGGAAVTQWPLKREDADFRIDPARTRAAVSGLYVSKREVILLFDARGVVSIDTGASLSIEALRVSKFRRLRDQVLTARLSSSPVTSSTTSLVRQWP